MSMDDAAAAAFYDGLAPFYHLVYPDWAASITRQAAALQKILADYRGESEEGQTILDVACGIGTQALGLAALGYRVTACDLSSGEVERARREAVARSLDIRFGVADMREVDCQYPGESFDRVVACDNALPHLLTDTDLLQAFRAFYACLRPGGVCLITVRDYDQEERAGTQVKPAGMRTDTDGRRYLVFQVWEFPVSAESEAALYDLSLYLIEDRGDAGCESHVFRSRYYAVSPTRLMELMAQAGFRDVTRVDDGFYQPVLIGIRP